MTLKLELASLFLGTPIVYPNMDKRRSVPHARENARATLHPNKENFRVRSIDPIPE